VIRDGVVRGQWSVVRGAASLQLPAASQGPLHRLCCFANLAMRSSDHLFSSAVDASTDHRPQTTDH
jgi:hypothetical protein